MCGFINISELRHDLVYLENPIILFKIVRLAINRSCGLAGAFIFQKWDFVAGFGDDHALVTDAGKGKIFEFADALTEFLEGVFDGRDCLFFAAEQVDQIAEDFPVVMRLAGGDGGLVEALQTTAEVDHRAAFFGESGGGKHNIRALSSGVCQGVNVKMECEFREVIGGESSITNEVFAKRNECLDAAIAHTIVDRCQRSRWVSALPDQHSSRSIRIAIGSNEQVVGFAITRHEAEPSVPEGVGQLLGEEKFFIGHAARADDGNLIGRKLTQCAGDGIVGLGPACGLMFSSGIADERLGEPGVAIDVVEIEAMRIRHPAGIDLVVLTWSDAMDFVFASPNGDVGASAAVDVNGFGFLEEPDAHLEAEIVGGQGSDWADVGGVE